jgi:hypothetical protein
MDPVSPPEPFLQAVYDFSRRAAEKRQTQDEIHLDLFLMAIAIGKGRCLSDEEKRLYGQTYQSAMLVAQTLWALKRVTDTPFPHGMNDEFWAGWLKLGPAAAARMAQFSGLDQNAAREKERNDQMQSLLGSVLRDQGVQVDDATMARITDSLLHPLDRPALGPDDVPVASL